MADTIESIFSNMEAYLFNPALIQRDIYRHLEKVTNGEVNIIDATSPFVFNMEAATVLTAGFMAQDSIENRRQYSIASQTPDDLYLHMSDKDFLNRFAVPSKASFIFYFDEDEILNKLVYDPSTGGKKLTMPRNTKITVSGVDFSLQYPIEIRQPQHGGLYVTYVADKISPLQKLTTNQIELVRAPSRGVNWLCFRADVQQFNIQSLTKALSAATLFSMTISVVNQYCYARVYVQDTGGQWVEIRTTHTDQVYNVSVPTAVLRLVANELTVTLPQIYTQQSSSASTVRVDVYQTYGVVNMDLGAYPTTLTEVEWLNIDPSDNTAFSAPFNNLSTVSVASDVRTTGGRQGLTFTELRDRVIENTTGDSTLPITNVELSALISDNGFTMVTNIDNLTNRSVLATRPMPQPTDPNLITPAGASIEMIQVAMKEASTISTVIDNGNRITVTPETLYQSVNGIMRLVPDTEMKAIDILPPEQKALIVTNGSYYYSPFHYVFDASALEFESRAYYLDDPATLAKTFIGENDTTLMFVGTDSYTIVKNPSSITGELGYRLRIKTSSNDAFKALLDNQIFVQLAFIPPGQADRAYLNGTFVGVDIDTNERYYEFDLGTAFDVDAEHRLQMKTFRMYDTSARMTSTELTTTFDILYATNAVMDVQWQPRAVDKILGTFLLPSRVYGITNEQISIRFGYSLKSLWSQARTVASSTPWKRHETSQVRLYREDIYEMDPLTNSTISVGPDGELVYNIIHHRGDTVVDGQGNIVYDWQVGDLVRDAQGNPIPLDVRSVLHQIDLFLIEGVYKYASEGSALLYRKELIDNVVSWIVDGLTPIRSVLLEKTRIFYYPQATLGQVEVMTTDGYITKIDSGQSLLVKLTVPLSVKKKSLLINELKKTTIRIISQHLEGRVISISEIIRALMVAYDGDVLSVEISGLGGDKNYQVLQVMDETKRCSVRKRLVALPDDSLIVEEDITQDIKSLQK